MKLGKVFQMTEIICLMKLSISCDAILLSIYEQKLKITVQCLCYFQTVLSYLTYIWFPTRKKISDCIWKRFKWSEITPSMFLTSYLKKEVLFFLTSRERSAGCRATQSGEEQRSTVIKSNWPMRWRRNHQPLPMSHSQSSTTPEKRPPRRQTTSTFPSAFCSGTC